MLATSLVMEGLLFKAGVGGQGDIQGPIRGGLLSSI